MRNRFSPRLEVCEPRIALSDAIDVGATAPDLIPPPAILTPEWGEDTGGANFKVYTVTIEGQPINVTPLDMQNGGLMPTLVWGNGTGGSSW